MITNGSQKNRWKQFRVGNYRLCTSLFVKCLIWQLLAIATIMQCLLSWREKSINSCKTLPNFGMIWHFTREKIPSPFYSWWLYVYWYSHCPTRFSPLEGKIINSINAFLIFWMACLCLYHTNGYHVCYFGTLTFWFRYIQIMNNDSFCS